MFQNKTRSSSSGLSPSRGIWSCWLWSSPCQRETSPGGRGDRGAAQQSQNALSVFFFLSFFSFFFFFLFFLFFLPVLVVAYERTVGLVKRQGSALLAGTDLERRLASSLLGVFSKSSLPQNPQDVRRLSLFVGEFRVALTNASRALANFLAPLHNQHQQLRKTAVQR